MTKPLTPEDFNGATQDEQMDAINSILQNVHGTKVTAQEGDQMAKYKSGSKINNKSKHLPKADDKIINSPRPRYDNTRYLHFKLI